MPFTMEGVKIEMLETVSMITFILVSPILAVNCKSDRLEGAYAVCLTGFGAEIW